MNIAIILASGQGKRMGFGKNKVLLTLDKKPLIYYALSAFNKAKEIDEIVVTCRENEIREFKLIKEKFKIEKAKHFIEGGKERQDSASSAIEFVEKNILGRKNLILIFHNGANPFVSNEEIEGVIKGAKKYGACAVAHLAKDTIKEVDKNGFVEKTIDRKNLWNMQTPQAIGFNLAKKAFLKAQKDKFLGTDDVSLIERLGKKVKIIKASEHNFKITTPLDVRMAEAVLKIKSRF